MIGGEFYFVLHAPRQSGKTTCPEALARKINSDGEYYALACSPAALSNAFDAKTAMDMVVNQIDAELMISDAVELSELAFKFQGNPFMSRPDIKVRLTLYAICNALKKELVVFFD
ncbi:MAG: hypothetical protein LBQ12_00135 [Deltaproteobacteria bacterium]|nr:hypothetical protein [Deltaproteobacteria bacterium]